MNESCMNCGKPYPPGQDVVECCGIRTYRTILDDGTGPRPLGPYQANTLRSSFSAKAMPQVPGTQEARPILEIMPEGEFRATGTAELKVITVNAFTGNAFVPPDPGNVVFHAASKEMLKLTPEGEIHVRGRLIESDDEIREGFREWLRASGFLSRPMPIEHSAQEEITEADAWCEYWRREAFRRYPTPDAYDAACKALEKHRTRADALLEGLKQVVDLYVESDPDTYEWLTFKEAADIARSTIAKIQGDRS